jgi:hypothetical protein
MSVVALASTIVRYARRNPVSSAEMTPLDLRASSRARSLMRMLASTGGPALREFAIVLLFGLVLATSSTIFIAAPILLNLGEKSLRRQGAAQPSAASSPTARMVAGPRTAGKHP